MAPARARAAQEDLYAGGREKPSAYASAKGKKGNTTSAQAREESAQGASATASVASAQRDNPSIPWISADTALLHTYRQAYRLDAPASFATDYASAVLQNGIGKHSPTMAQKRAKRKAGKPQLATAVRKHFNNLAVNESDVIVDFLYKVKHRDEAFKLRFGPKPK